MFSELAMKHKNYMLFDSILCSILGRWTIKRGGGGNELLKLGAAGQ